LDPRYRSLTKYFILDPKPRYRAEWVRKPGEKQYTLQDYVQDSEDEEESRWDNITEYKPEPPKVFQQAYKDKVYPVKARGKANYFSRWTTEPKATSKKPMPSSVSLGLGKRSSTASSSSLAFKKPQREEMAFSQKEGQAEFLRIPAPESEVPMDFEIPNSPPPTQRRRKQPFRSIDIVGIDPWADTEESIQSKPKPTQKRLESVAQREERKERERRELGLRAELSKAQAETLKRRMERMLQGISETGATFQTPRPKSRVPSDTHMEGAGTPPVYELPDAPTKADFDNLVKQINTAAAARFSEQYNILL